MGNCQSVKKCSPGEILVIDSRSKTDKGKCKSVSEMESMHKLANKCDSDKQFLISTSGDDSVCYDKGTIIDSTDLVKGIDKLQGLGKRMAWFKDNCDGPGGFVVDPKLSVCFPLNTDGMLGEGKEYTEETETGTETYKIRGLGGGETKSRNWFIILILILILSVFLISNRRKLKFF